MDCVAINFRGCSGEENKKVYSYNSGKTDDVAVVIDYILNHYNYKNIILLGFSMGGNITLKYLGETGKIPSEVKGAIAVSAPCDLEGSSYALAKWYNRFYLNIFTLCTPGSKLCGSVTAFSQVPIFSFNRS